MTSDDIVDLKLVSHGIAAAVKESGLHARAISIVTWRALGLPAEKQVP